MGMPGRVVLLTGASRGIGAAAAKRLLVHGDRVFGTSRDPGSLPPDAPAIDWVRMDVRDPASVGAGVDRVVAAAGRLDAVVCNAGYGVFGSVEELSLEAARAQFETNVFGVLATLRACLPHLRRGGAGRVVLVGSLAGRVPIPFQAHYSATKAAVDALALALHGELHGSGVHVSLVEPGDVDTGFNDAVDFGDPSASAYAPRSERCRQAIEETMARAPGPEVVAAAIARALHARRPRVRYVVGADARIAPLAKRLLPDRLALFFIRRHFGI